MRLADQHCQNLRGPQHRLDPASIAELLAEVPGWTLDNGQLTRQLRCADFAAALALANRIGALADAENHHPDLRLGWGRLAIAFSTHDVGGLSRNDFICAARIDNFLGTTTSSESTT